MHFSIVLTFLAAVASLASASPSLNTKRDDTVCAPGTGFFQSCANGFRGCCEADACTIGYCPGVTETSANAPAETTPVNPGHSASQQSNDPTVCPTGTGFFQSCSNGFRGCCKEDACTIGYCPSASVKRQDPTVCAPGTGFFQSCSNGFRGCCQSDACTLGYCPTTSASEKRQDPTVCAPGTGFFQSCSNGFRGCCKSDACTLGYCPDLAIAPPSKRAADPTVCAPGTGFFQSCANGFRGCCKQDACTIGYCPDVKTFETVTKTAPQTTATPTPESKSNANADPTVCAPGTGFFQSCANGFRGCCKSDACTIGYCPSN
ncbi:hypothetical protein CCUS01_12801 [Colletotrichum cuscutae]|uniref:Uncharacterized protein n=1 Tax=Colletotrichum cuscutae TaxID=1209917 RepID=A0AAI9YDD7_9PEZI|nr:hypothetical protein CCUS01_12801 [Colletotrichum cuscutae]